MKLFARRHSGLAVEGGQPLVVEVDVDSPRFCLSRLIVEQLTGSVDGFTVTGYESEIAKGDNGVSAGAESAGAQTGSLPVSMFEAMPEKSTSGAILRFYANESGGYGYDFVCTDKISAVDESAQRKAWFKIAANGTGPKTFALVVVGEKSEVS